MNQQDSPRREMFLQLAAIVESTVPHADLRFKWNCPFYYLNNKIFVYLNNTKKGVDLAFCNGNKMKVDSSVFTGSSTRKRIRSMEYAVVLPEGAQQFRPTDFMVDAESRTQVEEFTDSYKEFEHCIAQSLASIDIEQLQVLLRLAVEVH